MRRDVDYRWRLAELMAANAMHNTTDLIPHLQERGIDLSPSQVYRLVTGQPERVSLKLLSACCDIFGCTPDDLITVTAAEHRRKRVANEKVVEINKAMRPRRARIVPDEH